MNTPPNLSKIEQLRARDGERCWLCDHTLDFAAPRKSKKAPTQEHLEAKCNGGSDKLDNLVLCHPGCNKQLGIRPKADKFKMREKRMKRRNQQMVATSTAKPPVQAKSAASPAKKAIPAQPTHDRARLVAAVDYWRRVAMTAGAAAIFAFGLSLGLLVSR